MPPGARRSLRRKLLAATLLPTVLVLGVFGLLAHGVVRRSVEAELGRRLATAAAGTAQLFQPFQIEALDPADEGSLTYATVRRRLEAAKQALGVRRVALVALDLTGRGDTDRRIALGARAHEFSADRPELERAAAGTPTASPLFWGEDGRPYKRAYARVGEGPVVGFAVVEGSAEAFAALAAVRRWFLVGGMGGLAAIVFVVLLLARQITRPLERLADVAQAIGRGELEAPVAVETTDEVGLLARRLEDMRAALRARDERLQLMLAGIAHEVRNPLGGLELYAGLLREALADAPERLEEVRRIEREIGYLKAVVSDFLEYARRPRPELAPVEVAPLLEEVAEVAGGTAGQVQVEVDGAGLVVQADRGQLRRALLNLARNALAAAGPTGVVVLAARRAADGPIACEVRDNGPGIPAELHGKIFEPFFTTREKGTGLGLAFVREIVQDHGGTISLDRAPEGGARFSLRLPEAS